MYLESTCKIFECDRAIVAPGSASQDELEIPDRETVPSPARRIVVLESERASFHASCLPCEARTTCHPAVERIIGHLSTTPPTRTQCGRGGLAQAAGHATLSPIDVTSAARLPWSSTKLRVRTNTSAFTRHAPAQRPL